MDTPRMIAGTIIGLAFALGNLWYWAKYVIPGETAYREKIAARYQVQIVRGFRGHWKVVGPGSAGRHFLIELYQIVYFMRAMGIWALAMIVMFGVFKLL